MIKQFCQQKPNTIKVLISKGLIYLYNNHDEFASVNNMLREYNEMKKEIKNPKNAVEYTIYKTMKTYFVSCKKKNTAKKKSGEFEELGKIN